MCERVIVEGSPLKLCGLAQTILWPYQVALAVATWDTEPGDWLVKLAPFFIPWFRVLVKNENNDFFPARPELIVRHARSRIPALLKRLRAAPRSVALPWVFLRAVRLMPALPTRVFRGLRGSGTHQLGSAMKQGIQPLPNGRGSEGLTEPRTPGCGLTRSSGGVTEPRTRTSGGGVFRFPNHLKGWDWRRVTAIAESTECRWLMFCHEKADTPLDDLLPLFDDPSTFVVSRQMDYRHWEPTLIPRTPFRQLQPDEASQILAPIGRVMLVDREKLLELGIPKCHNGCAAWFTIFWKAAAAGWRSYAVGGDEALSKTSSWPAEEAEFVANLVADPKIGKLGLQEPDLSRGNISFSGAFSGRVHRPSLGSRPKVLLVSPYLPFPLSHGGAVRIYNLCRELSDRLDFLLICFREQGEFVDYARLHEVFRQVYVVDRDHKAIQGSPLPQRVTEYDSSSLRALVADLCEREKPDFLQVEYTQLGGIRDAAPGIPAIWVEHDVTFPLYEAIGDSTEAAKWEQFERNCFGRYDAVWTMCEEDRQAALQAGAAADRTLVVPNGVDTDRFRPLSEQVRPLNEQVRPLSEPVRPLSEPARIPELCFVGAFRHYPNVLAFEALLRKIMPDIWASFPEARLRVVAGREPHRYWNGALDARVDLQEFVSDLRPLYASAWVVLAPLLVSAGTNIKVLEAMACGKAVVSTPAGCRGLNVVDGEDCIVREADSGFAAAIVTLLEDENFRDRLGRQARQTMEERFSWAAIADRAYAHYLRLQDGTGAEEETQLETSQP